MAVVIEEVTGKVEGDKPAKKPGKGGGGDHHREPEPERVRSILRHLERRRERLRAD